jgi:hypothetical protein
MEAYIHILRGHASHLCNSERRCVDILHGYHGLRHIPKEDVVGLQSVGCTRWRRLDRLGRCVETSELLLGVPNPICLNINA